MEFLKYPFHYLFIASHIKKDPKTIFVTYVVMDTVIFIESIYFMCKVNKIANTKETIIMGNTFNLSIISLRMSPVPLEFNFS